MQPFERDLFDDVIVTRQDIAAWLEAVPRIPIDSPRAAHYIKGYDVISKIKRAKLEGTFEATTRPRMIEPQSAAWWHRMCWA